MDPFLRLKLIVWMLSFTKQKSDLDKWKVVAEDKDMRLAPESSLA